MRDNFIPCVPPQVDAFLFIDSVGLKRWGGAIKKWQQKGWRVEPTAQRPGAVLEPKGQPFEARSMSPGRGLPRNP